MAELLFFVSHSPLGAITLFMLLLRTWQVLCKNILPSCLKEKLWDTSSALLFQYCFTCLESDRGLPEGMCRTSPDTKRITEAAHYMPRWWRHHHIAMQRERWIPGPQALSCFKKFWLLQRCSERHLWSLRVFCLEHYQLLYFNYLPLCSNYYKSYYFTTTDFMRQVLLVQKIRCCS